MINFPNTPAIGDLFYSQSNGVTYRWNGTLWLTEPSLGTGFGPTGDFCATTTAAIAGVTNAWVTLMPPVIASGNAGNWYNPATGRYTPPPGRYNIQGAVTAIYPPSAMTFYTILRKNGTQIANNNGTSGGANYYMPMPVGATVDANGTDWFDIQGYCNGGAGSFNSVMFLAYPLAGAKGAPGDQGAPGVPGSLNGWRQINRIVPTAAQPNVDFTNIPVDINDLILNFDLTSSANGVGLVMQFYNAAGTLVTTPYNWSDVMTNHTYGGSQYPYCMSSAAVGYNTGMILNYHTTGWYVSNSSTQGGIRGRVTINNIRDANRIKSADWQTNYLNDPATYWAFVTGGGVLNQVGRITGVRLSLGASFAAGGSATLWGSP